MGDPSASRWAWLHPWSSSPAAEAAPLPIPDRRSGGDRRSLSSQEGQRAAETRRREHRRAHARQPMPFGGVAPSGRVCCEQHGCIHADLVDLSEGGICVLLDSPMPLKHGDRLALTLHENFGFGKLEVELEVRWLVQTTLGLRVGARFVDPAFRPSKTFLKTYLEADFGTQRRPDV